MEIEWYMEGESEDGENGKREEKEEWETGERKGGITCICSWVYLKGGIMCIRSWVYLFRMQGVLACLPSTVVSLFIVVHELCKQYTSSQECNPPHTRAAPTCETAFISQFLHTKQ